LAVFSTAKKTDEKLLVNLFLKAAELAFLEGLEV